jgi:hypothetical protein
MDDWFRSGERLPSSAWEWFYTYFNYSGIFRHFHDSQFKSTNFILLNPINGCISVISGAQAQHKTDVVSSFCPYTSGYTEVRSVICGSADEGRFNIGV